MSTVEVDTARHDREQDRARAWAGIQAAPVRVFAETPWQ